MKAVGKSIAAALESNMTKGEDVASAVGLANAMQASKLKGVAANRLLEKLSATKDITPEAVVAALREALESVGVSAESAAKVALVQNLMEKSGVSPADLAKVTFLQKSLVDGGGDVDKIAASINQVSKPGHYTRHILH